VAGLTLAVGNIGALRQRSLKRLLAYSSIAQMAMWSWPCWSWPRAESARAVLAGRFMF